MREVRTVPFTAAQRATIRSCGLLMLPIGLLELWNGGSALIDVGPMLLVVLAWPLIGIALYAAVEVALGLGLLVGGVVFLQVARVGTVAALVRGLRALCLVFAIKAVLLLLLTGSMAFVMLAPMFRW
ncbi:hypothetical protein [Nannocystis pusilla]|uniref:hypothetical protein n=1 Tax=Nannocystis pusilla TaxID=889268 RepID=UPI003B81F148